ncbi:MAG: peptidoglycan DD-metalloendopeptidase family protein [Calditrichaceae bacterium]
MYSKCVYFFLILLCQVLLVSGEGWEDQINQNRNSLDKIKSEIDNIQRQINKVKKKESSTSDEIALIDKKVAYISRARGLLERERRLLNAKIETTNHQLKETQSRLKKLKELYADRAVYAYKYGRVRNLELILTSASFNEALMRYKYLKLIAKHDERMIESIQEKESEIISLKTGLEKDLDRKSRNIREKKKEEKNYLSSRSKKQNLLEKIHQSQTAYIRQLKQKEREREQLIALIAELERSRQKQKKSDKPGDYVQFDFDDITRAKGKLPWPVKGKILTKYGRQRDPGGSKTYINNTDIEIQSKLGTPVKVIFTGVVRVITYLPGYGNTIIVDHNKGYYSVYSHLDEIYVQKDDFIKTGDVLATVGDSGSFSGAKLQFGIYGSQESYNPEVWLK